MRDLGAFLETARPAFADLESRYRAAIRTLGEAPDLTMQLDAASIAALADALSPTINVAAPNVNVSNEMVAPKREVRFERNPNDTIKSATVQDA